jgi:hypothetical protein
MRAVTFCGVETPGTVEGDMNTVSSTNVPSDLSLARGIRLSRLVAICMSLAIAGTATDSWGQTRTEESIPIEKAAGVVVDPGTSSIARLRLNNGNIVDFLDLLDGHVGVGEKARRGQRLASTYLASAWAATPLEIYLALAPRGSVVPQALRTDHEEYAARTGRSPAPRDLTAYLTQQGGGVSDLVCSEQDDFYWAWLDAFEGVTDTVLAAEGHQLFGEWRFYPGKHIYKGTNLNDITYLGTCNDHSFFPEVLTMEVHRRIKTVDNGVTSYAWYEISEVGLDIDEMYVFYSNLPASYRAEIRSPEDGIVEHYTVAVAYTKTPGLTISF